MHATSGRVLRVHLVATRATCVATTWGIEPARDEIELRGGAPQFKLRTAVCERRRTASSAALRRRRGSARAPRAVTIRAHTAVYHLQTKLHSG